MADSAIAHNDTIMQWGPLQFVVQPFNIHEYDVQTRTDWARKEIAGSAIFREWVGEEDENYIFRGRLFPYQVGGLANLELMDTMRRQGIAALMIRGGANGQAVVLGWFVIERLVRNHVAVGLQGVGRLLNFEASFARVPTPPADLEFAVLWAAGLLGV